MTVIPFRAIHVHTGWGGHRSALPTSCLVHANHWTPSNILLLCWAGLTEKPKQFSNYRLMTIESVDHTRFVLKHRRIIACLPTHTATSALSCGHAYKLTAMPRFGCESSLFRNNMRRHLRHLAQNTENFVAKLVNQTSPTYLNTNTYLCVC